MSEALRILHVEDSESDTALLTRLLKKAGYEVQVHRVEDGGAMRSALADEAWDAVIADYQLPSFGALEALHILQENGQDFPFIVLSGTIGEDRAADLMRAGAHDYVLKNNLARLVPALERECKEARARSQHRLSEVRQRELEEQFRQAQKMESIGRLAGGVAHDFNNLLTVISGYAEMALGDLAPQHKVRDQIQEIAKAAARASGLTRQLLAFSRQQPIEPQPIAVNDLLRNLEKMLVRLVRENVELNLELSADTGELRADPGQIEQVIMNLVVNASDAMPEGGRLLIETCRIVADRQFAEGHLSVVPGPYVAISLSDSGTGIAEDVKARIFEPFFTTKEPGKGTGLGLSMVYGIVTRSGGSIRVYSEVGRGTIFKLLFPAIETDSSRAAAAAPADVLPSGTETILLAEDEASVRAYTQRILEIHGYTVLTAANGREAVEVARRHTGPIHLVLADAVMPHLGGAGLALEMESVRPGVPVINMSGYSERFWRETKASPNYLQKPFTAATLLTRVRSLIDSQQTPAIPRE
jgi:signal transduction histidine kinase